MSSQREKILGLGKEGLIELLVDGYGEDRHDHDFDQMDERELIDFLIEHHEPGLSDLHSECCDEDFDPMHPDETVEEFFDHEDRD